MSEHAHVCPWWLAYSFDNPLRKLFHDPVKLFSPYVRPGMHVADIGCGMGYFSIGLAQIVGEQGQVYSVDIQDKMLDILVKRAKRKNVANLIHPRKAKPDQLNTPQDLDFILASWMVHETGDIPSFFKQVHDSLKSGGFFYMLEPKMHIDQTTFDEEVAVATGMSLQIRAQPTVAFSHTIVFQKE